ncbi:MAG: hypothetical protein KatS3mg110_0478 [Pirellulaceae bacterium]|nr:MAG: hypothetical protein KatS3mg110_0478 [Pirellulaceae bacterium]
MGTSRRGNCGRRGGRWPPCGLWCSPQSCSIHSRAAGRALEVGGLYGSAIPNDYDAGAYIILRATCELPRLRQSSPFAQPDRWVWGDWYRAYVSSHRAWGSSLVFPITVACCPRAAGSTAASKQVRKQIDQVVRESVKRFWAYRFRGTDLIVALIRPSRWCVRKVRASGKGGWPTRENC